jgi:hypothetical protein
MSRTRRRPSISPYWKFANAPFFTSVGIGSDQPPSARMAHSS